MRARHRDPHRKRIDSRPRTRRNNVVGAVHLGEAAEFDQGHFQRPHVCPKCAAPMTHEPSLSHCWNGHTFYIRGTDYRDQQRYEEQRGLTTALAESGASLGSSFLRG